jgi:hypothetical protein
MNELDQAKLEQWRLDEQRRIDQRREDDLKAADQRRADDQARAELRHLDATRLANMRASADPATREIGEKVQRVMDSRDRQEARDRELTGRASPIRGPHGQELSDPHNDPGWLARWEREGTLVQLTPAEREKLREIDRQDPMGREMRDLFLPREVLGIRAHSDRWVAEREQAKAAMALAEGRGDEWWANNDPWAAIPHPEPQTEAEFLADEGAHRGPEAAKPDHIDERAPEQGAQEPTKSEPKAPAVQHTQDEDEELEM